MKWLANEMTLKWNDKQMKWQANEMTSKWNDKQIKWLANQMTSKSNEKEIKWLSNQLTSKSNDWQMKWLANEMTQSETLAHLNRNSHLQMFYNIVHGAISSNCWCRDISSICHLVNQQPFVRQSFLLTKWRFD
jgi:hypothetical protein